MIRPRYVSFVVLLLFQALSAAPIGARTVRANDIPGVDLNGVSFPTATRGWVVGNDGVVFVTSDGGATWRAQTSGTTASLLSVDFVDSSHGWAVGAEDTVIRTDDGGATWTPTSTGIPLAELRAVDFIDKTHGWAVGASETLPVAVATTDGGGSWIPQAVPAEVGLNDVSFADRTRGLAVGFLDSAFRTIDGGMTWVPMAVSSDVEDSFDAVIMRSPQIGVAAGFEGRIHRTGDGGVIWEQVADLDRPITDLAHAGNAVFAVGEDGLLARSEDAGETWAPSVSGTSGDLHAVAAPTRTTAVAVGALLSSGSAALKIISFGTAASPEPVNVRLKPERCDVMAVAWRAKVPGEPRTAVAADLDGDGTLEVVVGGPEGVRAVHLFAPMVSAAVWELPLRMLVTRIVRVELDGDPGPEIAVGVRGSPSRSGILALDGKSGDILWRARVLGGVSLLRAADLNADGASDLVVAGSAHALYVLSGRDGSLLREPLPLGARPSDLEMADLNGDEVRDVVVVTADAKALAFDGADGSPLWTYQVSDGNVLPVGSVTQRRDLEAVAVGDVTADGTPDVVLAGIGVPQAATRGNSNDVGSRGGGLVAALDGRDGTLLWDYAQSGIVFRAVELAHLTDDGAADVVAHGSAVGRGRLLALDGRGRTVAGTGVPEPLVLWAFDTTREIGTFQNQGVPSPDALVIHDADEDGTPDVLTALESGRIFAVSGRASAGAAGDPIIEEPTAELLWERARSDVTRHNFVGMVAFRGHRYVLTLDSDSLVSLRDVSAGQRVWTYDGGGRPELDFGDLDGDGNVEIVVGRGSGRVVVLDARGRRLTRADTFLAQPVRGVAAVEARDGVAARVVAAARDGTVRALHPSTGVVLWTERLDDEVAALAGGPGAVAVGTTDGRVVGLDPSTGRIRFEERLGEDEGVTSLVFSEEEQLFAAGGAGGTLVFLKPSGRRVGSASSGSAVAAIAPLRDGGGYAVATGTSFQLFSSGGAREWTVDVPGLAVDVAVADLDGDGADEVLGRSAFSTEPRRAYAFSGGSGQALWQVPAGYPGGLGALDLDGDGDEEALIGNSELVGSPGVRAIDLDGSTAGRCRARRSPDVIEVADVDGDGRVEAVVGMIEGDLYFLDPR